MHAVEGQQVGVVLGGTEVVDGNELDIVALGFHGGAHHQTANAPETVDTYPKCHFLLSLLRYARSLLNQSAAFTRRTTSSAVILNSL